MRRKLLPIAVVAALAAGCGETESVTRSDKTSTCGQVGLRAADLGLKRTRELTRCLSTEGGGGQAVPLLGSNVRLEAPPGAHGGKLGARRFFEHDTPEGLE